MASQVTLHVSIEAYRRPRLGVAIGAGVGAIASGAAMIYRIVNGSMPDWPFLVVFPGLVGVAWREASTKKRIDVVTTARIDGGGVLTLFLPGTRLVGDRYVDQLYEIRVADILDVRCYAPNVMIRARQMTSVALDGGVELSREGIELGEISFQADAQGCNALREMLLEAMRS